MTDGDKIRRAARAREILDDPMVVEAIRAVEAKFTEAWRRSPAESAEQRERAWYLLNGLDQFLGEFASAIVDGRIAEDRITQAEAEKPSTSR